MPVTILRALCLAPLWAALYGQTPDAARVLEKVSAHADRFRREAKNLLSTETLRQRCYRIPERRGTAAGRGPGTPQVVLHEIQSEYRMDTIPNDRSGNLVEFRAVMSKDGETVRTRSAAVKELRLDASQGEAWIHKRLLDPFTGLGLLDVATNYGPMLLLFTPAGMPDVEIQPLGLRFFGAEQAIVFRWRQRKGGVLELRDENPIRRPMRGELWARVSDGMPLRITSRAEYDQAKHRIREDATLELVWSSAAGCAMPLLAAHRHYVDGQFLTENFYTYAPFRRFGAETEIRYSTPSERGR